MNAKSERFVVVSFTPISETYFVAHLQMSQGNGPRGIMGIRAAQVEREGDTVKIPNGKNRPSGVPLHAELSLKDRQKGIEYP